MVIRECPTASKRLAIPSPYLAPSPDCRFPTPHSPLPTPMVQTLSQTSHTLDAVTEQYFENFNQGNYAAVATLFSDDGCLCPPFEEEVVGPPAIAAYLAQEAAGMRAIPKENHAQITDQGCRVTVKGRVKTPLFAVNVQWIFDITAADQIQRAEIKLLASLQELLPFNRG